MLACSKKTADSYFKKGNEQFELSKYNKAVK
jgi:hypothetical protein